MNEVVRPVYRKWRLMEWEETKTLSENVTGKICRNLLNVEQGVTLVFHTSSRELREKISDRDAFITTCMSHFNDENFTDVVMVKETKLLFSPNLFVLNSVIMYRSKMKEIVMALSKWDTELRKTEEGEHRLTLFVAIEQPGLVYSILRGCYSTVWSYMVELVGWLTLRNHLHQRNKGGPKCSRTCWLQLKWFLTSPLNESKALHQAASRITTRQVEDYQRTTVSWFDLFPSPNHVINLINTQPNLRATAVAWVRKTIDNICMHKLRVQAIVRGVGCPSIVCRKYKTVGYLSCSVSGKYSRIERSVRKAPELGLSDTDKLMRWLEVCPYLAKELCLYFPHKLTHNSFAVIIPPPCFLLKDHKSVENGERKGLGRVIVEVNLFMCEWFYMVLKIDGRVVCCSSLLSTRHCFHLITQQISMPPTTDPVHTCECYCCKTVRGIKTRNLSLEYQASASLKTRVGQDHIEVISNIQPDVGGFPRTGASLTWLQGTLPTHLFSKHFLPLQSC